ncbi:unnamed protein product, partial [marine sediment metagenome]
LIVDKIARKVKRESKQHFQRMGRTVDIGADGTPTKYIDKIAEEKPEKSSDVKSRKTSNINLY